MSLESEESLNVNFDDLLTEAFRDPDLGHLWFLGTLAYPTFSERKHVINFAKAVASLKTNALAEHFHKRIFLDKRLRGITAKKAQRNIGHVLYTRIPRRMQGVANCNECYE